MDAVKVEDDGQYFESNIDADTIRKAFEVLERTRWIPVGERFPEEDGEYLVYADWNDWGGNKGLFSCEFVNGEWMVDANTYDHITHWMPLPKPPEVK